nr:hypothetical protein [Haladaptatus sp. R4]
MALPTDWEMGPEWEGYNSVDEGTHEALALWAADCAEHVLPLLRGQTPGRRPTQECHRSGAGVDARRGVGRRGDRNFP